MYSAYVRKVSVSEEKPKENQSSRNDQNTFLTNNQISGPTKIHIYGSINDQIGHVSGAVYCQNYNSLWLQKLLNWLRDHF